MSSAGIDTAYALEQDRARRARDFRNGTKPTAIEPESRFYCRGHMDSAVNWRGAGCKECAREARDKQYWARKTATDNESQERESY